MELGAEVRAQWSRAYLAHGHKGRKDGRIWPIHIDFHRMAQWLRNHSNKNIKQNPDDVKGWGAIFGFGWEVNIH